MRSNVLAESGAPGCPATDSDKRTYIIIIFFFCFKIVVQLLTVTGSARQLDAFLRLPFFPESNSITAPGFQTSSRATMALSSS
ncbi:hypothetical protein VTN00DRAFT_2950 [Thermoascus crustaceus]|uniref:uncharacterized protein n=1 Tax=Thermoascus crustaceus TaxID=5088 RepID=UPI003743F539